MTTTYNVYRGGSLIASGVTATTYHDAGLTNGTPYSYQVSAVIAGVEGPRSSAIIVTPQAAGSSPSDLQAAINATPSGGVLDVTGSSYTGAFTIAKPITLKGAQIACPSGQAALTVNAQNVILDTVLLDGTGNPSTYSSGVWATRASNIVIRNSEIRYFVYAGIGLWSTNNPLTANNHIHHIGPGDPADDNAYGIFHSSDDGSTVGVGGFCQDNLIEYVTTWQGINVHASNGLTIQRNTVQHIRRGIWIATGNNPRISNVKVLNNRVQNPLTTVGGDTQPYFNSATDGCTYDGNSMSPDWAAATTPDGGEFVAHIRDYGSGSTGLVRTNTTVA